MGMRDVENLKQAEAALRRQAVDNRRSASERDLIKQELTMVRKALLKRS
jgi:hypothetical protein